MIRRVRIMKLINTQTEIPYMMLEVRYPDGAAFHEDEFYNAVEDKINEIKAEVADSYERKEFWGEKPHFRFFKKFKKTYPVLLQFESLILKDRPFPRYNAIREVPFIAEISTGILSGAHCIDRVKGDLEIYISEAKDEFTGIRGETIHTYPGDLAGRDEGGIILSLIAGADDRTCVIDGDRYVFYPVFGCPGLTNDDLMPAIEELKKWVGILCPEAVTSVAG